MLIQIKGVLGTAVYLAVGLLVYLWLGTYSVFAWNDPWVFVYMALWPFILVGKALFWVGIVIAIVVVIFLAFHFYDEHKLRVARRNIRTIKKYVDKKSR